MAKRFIVFIILFILWLLLTFTLEPISVLVGLAASVLVSLTFKKNFWTKNPEKFLQGKRFLKFFEFLGVFAWECVKANFDMAFRVLHPKMPLKPAILKVKTNCRTETSITFLANFITLTPGTFTLDADLENGFLYIHCVNAPQKSANPSEDLRRQIEKFEKLIIEVFE